MGSSDTIEREVVIDAPVARVWSTISEPGWWVGDGDVSGHRRWEEDGLVILEDPRYGRFPIRVEHLEPQRYASFRWASGFPGEAPTEGNSTLVEFWLAEQDGGTLLRARESGFDSLAVDSTVRDDTVTGNTKGWMQQLGFLRARAERVA